MSTQDPTEMRLLKLEEKVAYQDKTIADLNDVVIELNQTVTALARRLEAVERLVRAELGRRDMPDEKPPHY